VCALPRTAAFSVRCIRCATLDTKAGIESRECINLHAGPFAIRWYKRRGIISSKKQQRACLLRRAAHHQEPVTSVGGAHKAPLPKKSLGDTPEFEHRDVTRLASSCDARKSFSIQRPSIGCASRGIDVVFDLTGGLLSRPKIIGHNASSLHCLHHNAPSAMAARLDVAVVADS